MTGFRDSRRHHDHLMLTMESGAEIIKALVIQLGSEMEKEPSAISSRVLQEMTQSVLNICRCTSNVESKEES